MIRNAVLLATYNGEKYLPELLNSLEAQTCRDFVCFIHDDGSTDDTRKILLDYVLKDPNRYVILDYPATGSAKGNFLSLLEKVEAENYLFSDQDDVWMPDKLETLQNAMGEKRDTPVLLYSDMKVVSEDLSVINESFHAFIGRDPHRLDYRQILIDNPVAGCTAYFNKALREKAIEYTYIDEIEMHDSWIAALCAIFGEIRYIETPLVMYRQHSDNVLGAGEQESGMDKIKRNLKDLFSGEFAEKKRRFHERMRLMAHQLSQVEDLPDDVQMTLREFIDLPRHAKSYRMAFYRRNGFKREHHDLWFRLTC